MKEVIQVPQFTSGQAIGVERRIDAALGSLACRADVQIAVSTPWRVETAGGAGYSDYNLVFDAVAHTKYSGMGTARHAVALARVVVHVTNSKRREWNEDAYRSEFPALICTTSAEGKEWMAYECPNVLYALGEIVSRALANQQLETLCGTGESLVTEYPFGFYEQVKAVMLANENGVEWSEITSAFQEAPPEVVGTAV